MGPSKSREQKLEFQEGEHQKARPPAFVGQIMDRDEIIFWKMKYDKEEDLYVTGVEEELRRKFRENGFVSKEDLKRMIEWKFQGRLYGRQRRVLKLMEGVEDAFIQDMSRLAFKNEDDKTRLHLLTSIRGVGSALSSVILAFYDPQNYGVFDIHAWRGLFGKEPKDLFVNRKRAIEFFAKLREISSKTGLACRDVEKAIFKKDLDKG